MKQNGLFCAMIFLLVSACAPSYTPPEIPKLSTPPPVVLPMDTMAPTATIPLSPTPILAPTLTVTPDIVLLKTQGVTDPWIVTILGTEIPPPWHSQSAVFSPDGKLLVSSYSNKITLWEVGSFRKLNELTFLNENYDVDRFAFSSDSRFLAATTSYYDDAKTHLFVWNTSNMQQIFKMDLEAAILDQYSEYPLEYSVNAIAFVPNSSRLVAANGNTIQIIDMETSMESVTMQLGQDIYAENISFPGDGRFIYVFMEWLKDHGITAYPPRYETKYVLQIWDTNTQFLWRTLEFLDPGWTFSRKLHNSYLVTSDSAKATLAMMSLENEEVRQLPYRGRWYTITNDNKYILFSRSDEEGIEFWTTDSWRMIYRFKPKCQLISDISSDNELMASACAGQVIIYDLRIVTSP
jgi:WD40 repeat protein